MALFKLEMENLTELIICTGYEERLIEGEVGLGNEINWFTHDPECGYAEDMTPILAGGRLITPEEIDPQLAEVMGIDEYGCTYDDVDDKSGGWCKRSATAMTQASPVPYTELIFLYDPEEDKDPVGRRDSHLAARIKLSKEVKELCESSGQSYAIEKGLCLHLEKCFGPLQIANWLKEQFYCACFSPLGIYDMSYIQNESHRILIVNYDAESG